KILVGQNAGETVDEIRNENTEGSDSWKSNYSINPNVNEYGNGRATIVDFAVVDDSGNFTNAILKGSTFTVKSRVRFNEDIANPIFTMSFKTLKGIDVTGTNTMYEKVELPLAKAGEEYVASFTQEMNMQGGEYLMSISCTGYEGDDFVAYHRLYDVISISVVSTKNTVGYYDMNSVVTLEKL
ncbi:MAG: Wzt carbohydrate-binding domain-containing protein, partial [Pseudobutyrivibrio sp.]|nr:Wzt carbohydrate-binding domain-containing protein [Pseudobutyrivibrio sp.]